MAVANHNTSLCLNLGDLSYPLGTYLLVDRVCFVILLQGKTYLGSGCVTGVVELLLESHCVFFWAPLWGGERGAREVGPYGL